MKYKFLALLIVSTLCSIVFVSNADSVSSQRISIFFPDDGAKPYEKRAATFTQNTFFSAVLGHLLQVSAGYDIEPGLIESYRWDFKENCYFLELQKGVIFHNGREATAADLEFTLIRSILKGDGTWESTLLMNILGADKLKSGQKYQPGMLEGIKIIGERRIRVTLASPNPAFLFTLTRSTISLVPREELEEDLNTWKRFPVGAGKYRVISESETGSKVELEVANKNETDIPRHVTLFTKGDYSSADILFGMVKNPDAIRFEEVINNSPFGVSILQFNFNSNIAKNDNFRMAVKYGLNRKELLIGESDKEPVYEILPATHWGRLNVKDPYDELLAKSFLV